MRKWDQNSKRLFGEKDEIVLLQVIIDYKGKNPLEDSSKRRFRLWVGNIQLQKWRWSSFCFESSSTKVLSVVKGYLGELKGYAIEKSKESKKKVTTKRDLVSCVMVRIPKVELMNEVTSLMMAAD